uniref:Uncharacterized protein n=1 Tax=Meloidogyne hapla TaxID=6305 RepID=A0A1I8BND9_MELHA
MRAFMLTKPVYIAVEMIKFSENERDEIDDVRLRFFDQVAATQTSEELLLIKHLVYVLSKISNEDLSHFIQNRHLKRRFNYGEEIEVARNIVPSENLEYIRNFNVGQLSVDVCLQGNPTVDDYKIMSTQKALANRYLHFKAICSCKIIGGEIDLNNDPDHRKTIALQELLFATMMMFKTESAYSVEYNAEHLIDIIGLLNVAGIGNSYKEVLKIAFDLSKVFLKINIVGCCKIPAV